MSHDILRGSTKMSHIVTSRWGESKSLKISAKSYLDAAIYKGNFFFVKNDTKLTHAKILVFLPSQI